MVVAEPVCVVALVVLLVQFSAQGGGGCGGSVLLGTFTSPAIAEAASKNTLRASGSVRRIFSNLAEIVDC